MKLFLADDAALIREGLGGILERAGHEIVGYANDAQECAVRVRALMSTGSDALDHAPDASTPATNIPATNTPNTNTPRESEQYSTPIDVLITDVRMPPNMTDDGLRAAVQLRREFPRLSVMILSQYVAPTYASTLFDAASAAGAALPFPQGGLGYLLKDRVARVADFMRSLSIVASGGVVVDPEVASGLVRSKTNVLAALTAREREVLELMAQGLSNAEISAALFLPGAAVAKHVTNVFSKLGLQPGEDNRRVRAVLAYLTATGVV